MFAQDVSGALRAAATPSRAKSNAWFFKTGAGEYGEGDKFLGVTVPQQRKISKLYKNLPLEEAEKLLLSPWHEERLTGLFILVEQFPHGSAEDKQIIYDFYIAHTSRVNNWDLVDSSASHIVGAWLDNRPKKMKILRKLANSNLLWDKRIAMIATLYYIAQGRAEEALEIAKILVNDEHDLIQKAVGWMLREVGKRANRQRLIAFLDEHAGTMPRTTLRYAIEHFAPAERQYYLKKRQ